MDKDPASMTKSRATRSSLSHKERSKPDNQPDQGRLEDAILRYQHALQASSSTEIDEAYKQVCNIYPPLNFVRQWFQKYRHLYDTRDDFVQDYLLKFCEVLAKWKPRDLRPESRYGGTGEFKNYFIGSLHYHYINMVKRQAAGRRNLASKCPICDIWCQALSTHLLKKHTDLLWEQMDSIGMPVDGMTTCPFCKSHKVPRNVPCEHQVGSPCLNCWQPVAEQALRDHLLSMHSPLLFERFRELYPSHTTLSARPMSVYFSEDESGEDETNVYDVTPETGRVDALLSSDLSPIQRQIIEKILIERSKDVSYDAELYNCTSEEFEREMDDLRLKMLLCGLEE